MIEQKSKTQTYAVGVEAAIDAIMSGENVFITGGGGCVDKDTEYLSPQGWKKISDYRGGPVMVFQADRTARFEEPENYVVFPCEKMTHVKTKFIDMVLSDEHRVIYARKDDNSRLEEISMSDLVKKHNELNCGFQGKFIPSFSYSGPGLDFTEGELRLQVAVIADGRIVKNGKDNYCQMRFSKKRKYDRLLKICKDFGLRYKDNGAREATQYRSGVEYEVIVWPKTDDKYFTSDYYRCNKQQLAIITEEVYFWDGDISGENALHTTNKAAADFVQFAFSAQGVRAGIKIDRRDKYRDGGVCYSVVENRATKYVSMEKYKGSDVLVEELIPLDGKKYCFRVSSGMWVMRRDGKVIITGNTGKSHIINSIRQFFSDDTLFIAPTGLAALNIRGMSCHKALGLSLGVTKEKDLRSVRSDKQADLMKSKALSRIVIDEVSMLRSDKVYEMDMKLRYFRKCDKPFGGLQVVVLGDGFQLSAVLTTNEEPLFREIYGSEIPFGCWSWMQCNFKNVILLVGHRQDDKEFLAHLNNMRMGVKVSEAVNYINSKCYHDKLPDPSAVTLCSTNRIADALNEAEYQKIPGQEVEFKALVKGEFKERPVPENTKLKVGAKVMITANDLENDPPLYVNGTTGTVVALNNQLILVDVGNEKPVSLGLKTWENIEYVVSPVLQDDGTPKLNEEGFPEEIIKEKKLGSYTAFPIKLGYALTIHKSQGMTLKSVRIDLGYSGAFTPGQAYVALSRATTVEGIQLVRQLRVRDIIVDNRVVSFYNYTFPNLNKGEAL